ncbi:hypothetical protein AB0M02_45110 [Actinoplanes sp. NPDC051861]|uniref:hypothetical protein n=1 Tax=Actinoplanes sp. NPDC051861 TaxID=3155170 RepID=UPI003433E78F
MTDPSSPPSARAGWLSRPQWAGVGSVAGALSLLVAVAAWLSPRPAESSAAPRPESIAPGAGSDPTAVPGPQQPRETSAGTYLYDLPGNSAGQRGSQREPRDVTLAGSRYPHSTLMTACSGYVPAPVRFHPGTKYQRLVGELGIAEPAEPAASATVALYADGKVWQGYVVGAGQTVPIDLDISRFAAIEVRVISVGGCYTAAAPQVYLGDGMVT